MLADILPDKYGNALINAWLVANGRRADSMNPVDMLCFVGNRGMGALEWLIKFNGVHISQFGTTYRFGKAEYAITS